MGKTTLTRELERAGFKPREFYHSEDAVTISDSLGQKSLDDVFVNIGFGRISTKQIIARLMQKDKPKPSPKSAGKKASVNAPLSSTTGSLVRLVDIDNIMYRIAKCCNPLPGDSIIGFVTRGRGVTIHKEHCRSIKQFTSDPGRVLSLFWTGDRGEAVSVVIEVRARNRNNLLVDLSQMISSSGTNIIACNTQSTTEKANLHFTLGVTSITHLNSVMQQLLSIEGVKTVRRIRSNGHNVRSKPQTNTAKKRRKRTSRTKKR